jgi:transcriptional regulator with XRE-family HTH domain
LKHLGANLRTARIRRRFTREQIAQKIGVGIRAVSDAEKGKPSSSIAIYMALSREGVRVRHPEELDNDFVTTEG